MLGLYGGADTGIPLDTVEQMKAALGAGSAAREASEFVVYPRRQHAFHADYRPSYRTDAADGRLAALPRLAARARRSPDAATSPGPSPRAPCALARDDAAWTSSPRGSAACCRSIVAAA